MEDAAGGVELCSSPLAWTLLARVTFAAATHMAKYGLERVDTFITMSALSGKRITLLKNEHTVVGVEATIH